MKNRVWKELHPAVRIILIGSVLTSMANGLIVPYFAIYLGEYTSLSIAEIGFLIGASSLAGMFGGFFGGSLSDKIGRRKVMIASLLISSLFMLGLSFHFSPYLLMFFTVIKGFALSLFDPCAKALIGDLTESGKRLRAFSMKYFCGNLGFAIGPIIGTILGLKGTSIFPFIFAFIVFLAYSIILNYLLLKYKINTITVQDEKITFKASIKVMSRDKILFVFLLGGLLATIVHGQFSVILSNYFYVDMKSGLGYLGILWSAHSLVVILLSLPITKWMDKRAPMQSIIIGTVLFAIGIIGFGLSHNFAAFLLSMIVFTTGEIFLIPAEYAIIDEITPNNARGTYYGAVSFTALGSFIGPGISGFLLMEFNSFVMFFVLTVISLVSILFYYFGVRMKAARLVVLEKVSV